MESTLDTNKPAIAAPSGTRPLPFADHIRNQFESLRRQPELASDMDCFRTGATLSSIRYIAHPHGLHVARWLKVLSHTKTRIAIDTANPVPAFANEYVSAIPLLPRWLRLPMTLRYFFSGLVLRFLATRPSNELIHAHCASGNGLVAWMSGRRYVLGTYGSEIYGAKERGRIYCWLLKKILQKAERISVGSLESIKILVEEYDIPAERIYFFHLGYDDTSFRPLGHSHRMQLRQERQLPTDELIWVVNRRTDPHYRTMEVVNGFLEYCENGGIGRLILLCGDHQPEYTKAICDVIQSHAAGHRVVVVERMLSSNELASWVQLGDYSLSVPKTDNFSVSTVESMGCGTAPILANLEGYSMLRACPSVRWMTRFEPADFAAMFAETAKSSPSALEAQRKECFQFVQDGYSTDGAIRDIAAFYLGNRQRQAAILKRAA